jgi:PKD repeat protein
MKRKIFAPLFFLISLIIFTAFSQAKAALSKPKLISPPNGTTISTPPLILDWSDVEGAGVYQYEVKDYGTDEIIEQGTTSESQVTLSFEKFTAGGKYSWRVRACVDETLANCSNWSDTWTFRITPHFAGLITIDTSRASKWKQELMERTEVCGNMADKSRCWQVYDSCFDQKGNRIKYCHLTLAATFLSSFNYNFYFTYKDSDKLVKDKIHVGNVLKLNLGSLIGEWLFTGGTFDSPPVTFIEDAQSSYEKMEPIQPLYQYYVNAHNFYPRAYNVLKPKMGVAATNPLKSLQVRTNDKFEFFKEGNDYYFRAIKEGIGKIEITVPQVFAYSTIDNLWFERGYIPAKTYDFEFSILANNPPIANAGPDKEIFEGQSVVLEGSGSDPDGDPISFSWSCSGGTLSDPNVAQPTYTAPSVDQDTTYTCTLTVSDNKGASASDSMNVLVKNNNPPSAKNLSAYLIDGCSGCYYKFSWEFFDPDGQSQSAYRVQVDDNSDFSSPEIDSGKVLSSSQSFAPTTPLKWNTRYYWRLKVWDSADLPSDWILGPSFTTPANAYPEPKFIFSPEKPFVGQKVKFIDQSIFHDSNPQNRKWEWDFNNDGIIDSTDQNPEYSFGTTGDHLVTLKVTDGSGYACSTSTSITVSVPLPRWREVPP